MRETHLDGSSTSRYTQSQSQALARGLRAQGSQGIVYPSVRQSKGQCFAAFWPDVMQVPQLGRLFRYHWNGERVDYLRELESEDEGPIFEVLVD